MAISERKKKILSAVIEAYISTAEPVGSKTIAETAGLGCSSATIRNELAELVNMGYTLSAYAHKGGDVSFLAEKNGREYLVQVAERVAKKRVREKEFRPLNKLDNARKKILITNDEKDYSTSTVEHIRLKDFLMMEDLRG